jgi:hypothetical protein
VKRNRQQLTTTGVATLAAVAALAMPRLEADAMAAAAPVPLFDGRTFDGWQGDTKKIWRIEDGAIVAGSLAETVPRNDFLCTTRSYGDFILRVRFKLTGTEGFINGGIQFRSQRATKPAHEMIGYQADIGDKYWGSLYDETRRNKVLAQPPEQVLAGLVRVGDWNDYEIHAQGPRIRLVLNGRQTVDYTEPDDTIPRSGLIGLQVHGGGKAQVFYKDITIEELP